MDALKEKTPELSPGDRVRVKPGVNTASTIGVVKTVRDGHKRGVGPTVEVEVEFQGTEWYFPYWATFKQDELLFIGHGAAP